MVIGGFNSANNPLDSTEIYADNVWKTVAGHTVKFLGFTHKKMYNEFYAGNHLV